MDDFLGLLTRDHLSPELVSAPSFRRLRRLARELPPVSFGGLECRLGSENQQVDLHLGLRRAKISLPSSYLEHAAWRLLQEIVDAWVDPVSPLRDCLQGIFVSVDISEDGELPTAPSLYLQLSGGPKDDVTVLRCLDNQLQAVGDCERALDVLHRWMDSFFPGASLMELGVMTGRPGSVIRAQLFGMTSSTIRDFLRKTPSLFDVDSQLLEAADDVDRTAILVDVAGNQQPEVGIEFYIDAQPPVEDRWSKLLDDLVRAGACTAKERQALLRWPGARQQMPGDSGWPAVLTLGDRLLRERAVSLFWRRLSHIKLSPYSAHGVRAKAYLAFGHTWIPRHFFE